MPFKHFTQPDTYTGIARGNRVLLHNGDTWSVYHDFTNLADVYPDADGVWVIERTDNTNTFDIHFMAAETGEVTFIKSLTNVYFNSISRAPGPFTASNGHFYYLQTDPVANDLQRLAWFTQTDTTDRFFEEWPVINNSNFGVFTTDLDQQMVAFRFNNQLLETNGYEVESEALPESVSQVKGLAKIKGEIVVAKNGGVYRPGAPTPLRNVSFSSFDSWNPFSMHQGQDRLRYMANSGTESHLVSDDFPYESETLARVPGKDLDFVEIGQYQGKSILAGNDSRAYSWDASTQTLEVLTEEPFGHQSRPVIVGDLLCFRVLTDWRAPGRLGFLSLLDHTMTEVLLPEHMNDYYGILHLVSFNDRAWFVYGRDTADYIPALWSSDGTQEGTQLVYEGNTTFAAGQLEHHLPLVALQDHLLFVVHDKNEVNGSEFYLYGTQDGTSFDQVLHFGRGTFERFGTSSLTSMVSAVFEDQLYFVNHTVERGAELWVTDGTAGQTQLFFEGIPGQLNSGIRQLSVHNQTLYWSALVPESQTYAVYGYRTTPDANFSSDYYHCLNALSYTAEAAMSLPGAVYDWTISGGQIQGDHTQRTISYEVSALQAELTLTVTYNGNSASYSRTLNVADTPSNGPVIAGPTTLCSGVAALYEIADPSPESEYVWSVSGGTILRSATEPYQIEIVWQEGNGSISVVETTRCGAAPETVLNVSATSGTSTAFAGPDQTLCDLTETQLQANSPTEGTGAWHIVAGSGGSLADAADPQTTFTGLMDETYELVWTVSNGTCAANSDTVRIVFAAGPGAADAGNNLDICGDSVTLSANAATSGLGYWQVISGSGGRFSDVFNPNATFYGVPGRIYDLRWTLDSESCGNSSDTISVAFRNTPLSDAGDDLCSDTAGITVRAATLFGSGMWEVVSGPDTGLDQIADLAAAQTRFTPMGGEGTYVLQWRVINDACSDAVDEVSITVRAPHLRQTVGEPYVGSDGENSRYIGFDTIQGKIIFATEFPDSFNQDAIWAYDPTAEESEFLGYTYIRNSYKYFSTETQLLINVSDGHFLTDGTLEGTQWQVLPDRRKELLGFVNWQGDTYAHMYENNSDRNLFLWQNNQTGIEPLLPADRNIIDVFTTTTHLIALLGNPRNSWSNQWLVMDATGEIQRGTLPDTRNYQLLDYYNATLEVLPYLNENKVLQSLDLLTQTSTPLTYLDGELRVRESLVFDDMLFVLASHPELGEGIYRTNGFPNTLELISDIQVDTTFDFTQVGDQLVWRGNDGLYRSSGAIGNRERFFEGNASELHAEGDTLFFFATDTRRSQVWRSDLSAEGTQLVWEISEEERYPLYQFRGITDQTMVVTTGTGWFNSKAFFIDLNTSQSFDPIAKDVHTPYITYREEHQARFGSHAAFGFINAAGQHQVGVFNTLDESLVWYPFPVEPQEMQPLGEMGFVVFDHQQQLHIFVENGDPTFQTHALNERTWMIVDNQLALLDETTDRIHFYVVENGTLSSYDFPADKLPAKSENTSEFHFLEGNWLYRWNPVSQQADFIFDHTTLPGRSLSDDVKVRIWGDYAFFHYSRMLACVDLNDNHLMGVIPSMNSREHDQFLLTKGWQLSDRVTFLGLGDYYSDPNTIFLQIKFSERSFRRVTAPTVGSTFRPRVQLGEVLYGFATTPFEPELIFAGLTPDNLLETLAVLPNAQVASNQVVSFGGEILFNLEEDTHGSEWWTSDGSVNGTRLLQDLNQGPHDANPRILAVTDQHVFFEAIVGVNRLWVYDGFCVSPLMGDSPGMRVLFHTFLGENNGQYYFKVITPTGELEVHRFTTAAPRAYSEPVQNQLLSMADSNGDGILSDEEAAQVEVLDISAMGVSSLAGIERFPNLRELYAADNQIRDLGPILRHANLGTQQGSVIDLSDNEIGQFCGQIQQLEDRAEHYDTVFNWQNQKEILVPVSPQMWPQINVLDLARGVKAIRGGELCAE
jgi:ELWxxDGT repeat protein